MPDYSYELRHIGPVAGVDEAGRGPLAGPVVAAAVVLDPDCIPEGLDDSKVLTAAKRAELHARLIDCARVGVGIDSIDVGAATELGVAITTTPGANEATVADGRFAKPLN